MRRGYGLQATGYGQNKKQQEMAPSHLTSARSPKAEAPVMAPALP
jgi:hypothetical protein